MKVKLKTEQAEQIGICTVCQTINVLDDTVVQNRICDDCGEASIKTIIELSDIANDYKALKTDYNKLLSELDTLDTLG